MEPRLSPALQHKYQGFLNLAMQSPAFYRYKFCGTRNKKVYLKVVARMGVFFLTEEIKRMQQYAQHVAGTDFGFSMNKRTGVITVTFYD